MKPRTSKYRYRSELVEVTWHKKKAIDQEIIRSLFAFSSILFLIMIVQNIPQLFGYFERATEKISSTEAGFINLIMGVVFIIIWIRMLVLALYGQFVRAFAIFILFFPVQRRMMNLYEISVYNSPYSIEKISMSITSISIILLFILMLYNKRNSEMSILSYPNSRNIFIFFIVVLFTQFFNHSPLDAIGIAYVTVAQPFLFYIMLIAIIKDKNDIQYLLYAFIGSLFLGVIVRFTQGVTASSLHVRVNSVYGQFIPYSQLLACYLPILISLYIWKAKENRKTKMFLLISIFLVLFELFNTGTRGVYFSFPALLLFFLYRKARRKIVPIIIVITIPIIIFFPYVKDIFFPREFYLDERLFELPSVYHRFEIDFDAARKLWISPIVGFGVGQNFDIKYSALSAEPHNTYVNLAIQAGIVAVFIFLKILYQCFSNGIRAFQSSKDEDIRILALGVAASMIAFFAATCTSGGSFLWNNLHEWKLMIFFLFALGTILYNKFNENSPK